MHNIWLYIKINWLHAILPKNSFSTNGRVNFEQLWHCETNQKQSAPKCCKWPKLPLFQVWVEGTLQETIIHFPVLFVVKYFPRRRVIKSIFLFSWKKAAAAVAAADTAVMAGDVSLFQVRKSARKVMDTILMARALVYTLTQTTALLLIPLTHNKPTWL